MPLHSASSVTTVGIDAATSSIRGDHAVIRERTADARAIVDPNAAPA